MTQFKKQFEALLDYWPHEGSELRSVRNTAFGRFKELGLPTKKWEEWQFTDFSDLKKSDFQLSWMDDLPNLPKEIPGRIPNTHLIFMINGHYQSQLSGLPEGLTVSTGLDHFNANPDEYNVNGNPFMALNTSMMNSGVSVAIENNAVIEKPIQVIYLMTDFSAPLMNHPRFNFDIGTNAEATIIEHYIGKSPTPHFVNSVSKIRVHENGIFSHIRLLETDGHGTYTATTKYQLNRDAQLNVTALASGGKLFRHDIELSFEGAGAEASLDGLSLTEKAQHHDQNVIVDHGNDACESHQLFKYILSDKASGVFNGKVVVREHTKQTNADQSNKNLLLSPKALMNANPQLEIYAEDVKCAHGSTTGQIDSEALFYLRSRGISKQKAIELIIGGFAKEIIDSVQNSDVKSYIDDKVTTWLEGTMLHG